MKNTLEISHISKSFSGHSIVKDISFNIIQSEIFGLIAPNGAGKTTIIPMILDIIKPDSGEIKILGEQLSDELKNIIGYLPEERTL